MHVCVRAKERKREEIRQTKRQSVKFCRIRGVLYIGNIVYGTFVHYDKDN